MANWDNLSPSGNVEDRRGFGPGVVGGLGVTGVVVYLLFTFLSGGNVDVQTVLNQLASTQVTQTQNYNSEEFKGVDSYEKFASTVLGSSNEMWSKVFSSQNKNFIPPKLVLFRASTASACGGAYSSEGPHYCPTDNTIYLDETFFEELTTKLGAQGGDVAEAYVIAHEAGHSAQDELGIMDQADNIVSVNPNLKNEISVKLELQADCFAGLWAYSIKDLGVFQPGEINEAIDAAKSVGDDRIQQETTGRVNPESWTHGSAAERSYWFNRGYSTGLLSSCDTFK